MSELPASVYWVVGILVVGNLGTIGTILFTLGKAVWWLSKLDSRVAETRDMSVRAHKRIDRVDESVGDIENRVVNLEGAIQP